MDYLKKADSLWSAWLTLTNGPPPPSRLAFLLPLAQADFETSLGELPTM